MANKKVAFCILDGWGEGKKDKNDAIYQANTPNWDRYVKEESSTLITTHGSSVGLPDGQMGNSEVGHMNIGAGRIVFQELPKIHNSIKSGDFFNNKVMLNAIKKLQDNSGALHLMGLTSDGGIHSHIDHAIAIIDLFTKNNIKVYFHALTDGRDTPPKCAKTYLKTLEDIEKTNSNFTIATVCGRYYAMDRDKRWDRVEKAYNAIVNSNGIKANTASEAIDISYNNNKTDEFIDASVIGDYQGLQNNDALIMFNFRADRAREIITAIVDPDFKEFPTKSIKLSSAIGMREYSVPLNKFLESIFPTEYLKNTIGEVVSKAGLNQLRLAETEKYPHVTFFLNGGREDTFKNEDRIMVPSPKVATYDMQPEMSAYEVTDHLTNAINSEKYGLIVTNYANGDMVGHTGVIEAAISAVEAVDQCLGKIEEACKKTNTTLFLVADHGNAEQMWDEKNNTVHTAHTTNLVRLIAINGSEATKKLKDGGKLSNLAPTILKEMGLETPSDMSEESLID